MEPRAGSETDGPYLIPPEVARPDTAAVLVMQDLAGAMFWKKPHFRGLAAEHYGQSARHALEEQITPGWLESLIAQGVDPVAHLLGLVWVRVNGDGLPPPRQWFTTETTLNCRCCLGFALLGAAATGELLGTLCPETAPCGSTSLALLNHMYRTVRSDRDTGQPDLLLAGTDQLWLCEMKVGGSLSSAPYKADQLLKYMHLAQSAYDHNPSLRLTHLLLGPESRPGLVRNRAKWYVAPATAGACATIDVEALAAARLGRRWRARMDTPEFRTSLRTVLDRTPFRLATYRQLLELIPSSGRYVEAIRLQWEALVQDAARPRS